MFLQAKIIKFLLIIFAIYLLVSYLVLETFFLESFKKLEENAAVKITDRVLKTIDNELQNITATTTDYVLWHKPANVIKDNQLQFASELHHSAEYLKSAGLNLCMIYSKTGRLMTYKAIDSEGKEISDLTQVLETPILANDKLIQHQDKDSQVKGIFNTKLGPMLLVSLPIVSMQPDEELVATLIYAALLDKSLVDNLNAQANVNFALYNTIDAAELSAVATGTNIELKSVSGYLVEIQKDVLLSYVSMDDIYGNLGVWIKTNTARTITALAGETSRIAFSFELIGSLVLMLGIWFFLKFFILGRIEHITQHVTLIQHEGDLNKRLNPKINDEIGTLARKFDQLIDQLQTTSSDLSKSRDKALELSNVKSAFLANMSHEIRTPLNGMLGFAELLQDSDLTPEQRRYAELIHTSGKNLLDIINDVLDFSKIEAGKIELESVEFDVRRLVEEVSEILAVRAFDKGLELIHIIPPNLNEHLKGDTTRLRQVLINLLGNAIKFTKHGQVVIRVSASAVKDADQIDVRFEVEDTGIGIADKQKKNIFESFTQEDGSTARKFGGSGLGLTISQGLIRKMGSNIFVESKPGEGAMFWFTVRFETLSDAENKTRVPTAYLQDKNALVVDTNIINLETLGLQLKTWGLKTNLFSDSTLALEHLKNDSDAMNLYDAVLFDDRLNKIDGFEFAQKIRAIAGMHQLPLIMLSGALKRSRAEQVKQLDIAYVLQKPVRQFDLYQSLSDVLGKAPSAYREKIEKKNSGREKIQFNARVLVAEDNTMNQLVARTVLEKCGCAVVMANDGQEAINLWLHKKVDIILMDLRMPLVDGFDATMTIREKEKLDKLDKAVPIIALTADVVKEVKDKAISAGMNDYMAKPFTQAMLIEALSKHIPHLRYSESNTTELEQTGKMQESAISSHIDIDAIELLRDLQEPGDEESVVITMMESYFETSERLIGVINDFPKHNDYKKIQEAVHSLKSSSGYLGAKRMVELCEEIYIVCKSDDVDGVHRLCELLVGEYQSVIIALKELLGKERLSV